ncbi:hypothetical protein ACHAXT_011379 [Thalassiosira profunda]
MAAERCSDISPGREGRSSAPSLLNNDPGGAGAPGANADSNVSDAVEESFVILYERGSNKKRGIIRWAEGDIYEGEIKDGREHGSGICKYSSGHVYDGEWKDGVIQGTGTYTWANGKVYEGSYNERMHGKGMMYQGEWAEGKPHGRGTKTWVDGDVYVGEWKQGDAHGWGTQTYANGDVYEGEFKDSWWHGNGTLTYSSGDVFEGQFKEGGLHGKVTWKDPQGRISEQVWANGRQTAGRSKSGNARGLPTLPVAGARANGTPSTSTLENQRQMRSLKSQERRLEAEKKACEHCGVDDYHYKLRVCSGCNLALYCSEACQKAANRSHRRICSIVSELPSQDADRLALAYDRDKLMDLDAGLRYGAKYMDNLKHLELSFEKMGTDDSFKLSTKHLSSLLRSKKGALESVFWLSQGMSSSHVTFWKQLHGLKQLRLEYVRFDKVQSLCDIIRQQTDTLMVLRLPFLQLDWSKAKCRRTIAQAVGACRHLVKLQLDGCVLTDSDLKIMLQDLPSLRILHLTRANLRGAMNSRPTFAGYANSSHEFTDNTCGLIARKCPGLQELNLRTHNQLSVRGVRKILEGCVHLRSFGTTTCKLNCGDIQSLLDSAPQLMYLSLGDTRGNHSFSEDEMSQIVEATGGRTVFQLGMDSLDCDNATAKTRETYERQTGVLRDVWSKYDNPDVANEWEGMFEG